MERSGVVQGGGFSVMHIGGVISEGQPVGAQLGGGGGLLEGGHLVLPQEVRLPRPHQAHPVLQPESHPAPRVFPATPLDQTLQPSPGATDDSA